jgi:PAS domain S-box-containing protein
MLISASTLPHLVQGPVVPFGDVGREVPRGWVRGASSREFLKLLEEGGRIGFFSVSPPDDLIEGTAGLCKILGRNAEDDLRICDLLAHVHPQDQGIRLELESLLGGGQTFSREFRIIRTDGAQRWISISAEIMPDRSGKPSRAVGVVKDVTEREEARILAEQQQQRLRAVASAVAGIMLTLSPDRSARDVSQWRELTGQSAGQARGHGWLDALHALDRSRLETDWSPADTSATAYSTRCRLSFADGQQRSVNLRFTPILNCDGGLREWVGLVLGADPSAERVTSAAATEDERKVDWSQLTPAQIRAARGLLGWSCCELAVRATTSSSTIRRLEAETGDTQPRLSSLAAVGRALERAGIEFTFDATAEPGIRPARPSAGI